MKKRKPTPLMKAKAEMRDLKLVYDEHIYKLSCKIARLQHELGKFKRAEERHKHETAANWAAYDRAVDATTQHERELFAASPQYQKYREWRRESYGAEEGKRVDAINHIHSRGRLKDGDWMAP